MNLWNVHRCGIGTLSRNRSRAGSVDESQTRILCRSVTPVRCSSAAPFDEKIAATLPRNFETTHDKLVQRINQKEEETNNDRSKYEKLSERNGTTITSGKTFEHFIGCSTLKVLSRLLISIKYYICELLLVRL